VHFKSDSLYNKVQCLVGGRLAQLVVSLNASAKLINSRPG